MKHDRFDRGGKDLSYDWAAHGRTKEEQRAFAAFQSMRHGTWAAEVRHSTDAEIWLTAYDDASA